MHLQKWFTTSAVSTLTLLAVAGAKAQAAYVLSQTENFGFLPNGSQQVTFDKFDDQGGTRVLQSVEVTLEFTKTGGSLAVDNDSASAGTIGLQHTINGSLTVVSGGISLLDLAFNPIGATLNATSSLDGLGIGATSGDPTTEFNNTGQSDYYIFAPSNLTVSASGTINSLFNGGYVAAGGNNTFVLNFGALQTTGATGMGGLQQAYVVSDVQGFVTVKYNYDVVPEPSAAMLGLIGTIGLVVRRRSR
ncbi:PEP-CTERM sorting domain-containing protein [Luteolibacter luteus]|uniref:PEP-CTERM sorting domain-containing protein n=1 Tax=Luteolibacter luteus TaxID=2728835 RepID=A0A858RD79_9BACT|nr:PEP-CTERM sorting domain-containing protein [Luteolibacter luteus]QJE94270.1 PEP-CTERM sorting domain-containing protein [Luteolibacter luteus]